MLLLYEQQSSFEQQGSHKEESDFLIEYQKAIQKLKEETHNDLFEGEWDRLNNTIHKQEAESNEIKNKPKVKKTEFDKTKNGKNSSTETKSDKYSYTIDFNQAMKDIAGFNNEIFLKWSDIIDQRTDIPRGSKDLMKALIISEGAMDKKSRIKKRTLERLYVFDEERMKAINGGSYYPIMPWTGVGSLLGAGAKKLFQIKQQIWDSKKEYENATGPFQIKGITFTTIICRSKELNQQIQSLLDTDTSLSNHPYKQLLKEYLIGKGCNNLNDQISHIINHPGCINLIQRLTFDNDLAIKVTYDDIKNTYAIWERYAGIGAKPEDIRLTTGLSHLLGPNKTYYAIVQQNLFLLGKYLNIDMSSINKPYMIDGEIKDNGPTSQLFTLIKNHLTQNGEDIRNNITLKDLIKTPKSIKDSFTSIYSKMSNRLGTLGFYPLLSISALQPLERSKEIHLKYIYHYLKAFQLSKIT